MTPCREEAVGECSGQAPEETPRPSQLGPELLGPELDIDTLEREMLAIMATNTALEETLAVNKNRSGKVCSSKEDSAKSMAQTDWPGGRASLASEINDRVDCACSREDCQQMRSELEASVEAARADARRLEEDYAAKFHKAKIDYTEKFRQVKEVCQQLCMQINGSEEKAQAAESREAMAHQECEELRRALAAPSLTNVEVDQQQQQQQLEELRQRVEKEAKNCADWRRMVIEEQNTNSELQKELQQARQAIQAEREAKRAARESKPPARRRESDDGNSDSKELVQLRAECAKLREQLEQARDTSRASLSAADDWKRSYNNLSIELEELKVAHAKA